MTNKKILALYGYLLQDRGKLEDLWKALDRVDECDDEDILRILQNKDLCRIVSVLAGDKFGGSVSGDISLADLEQVISYVKDELDEDSDDIDEEDEGEEEDYEDSDEDSDEDEEAESDSVTETSVTETSVTEQSHEVPHDTAGLSESDKDELAQSVVEACKSSIDNAVTEIYKVYTSMFKSGYGVIQPEGILAGQKSGSMIKFQPLDYEHLMLVPRNYYSDTWELLKQELGLKESTKRTITYGEIRDGYNYFPFKIIELVFGRYLSKESDIAGKRYCKSSASVSWESYWEQDVKHNIERYIRNIVTEYIKSLAANEKLDINNLSSVYGAVRQLANKTILAYTPAIVICEDSGGRFKIRFSDYAHRIDANRLKRIEKKILGWVGTKEVELDRASFSLMRDNDSIKEIEVVRDKSLCGTVPLFSYIALRKLREQGKRPSYQNLILGRAEDDSIYIGNSKDTPFGGFNTAIGSFVLHLSAGSRSGKGVMTLNMIASALASNVAVPYLDSKPDMSSLLLYLAKKLGVKTFALNGGSEYDSKADIGGVVRDVMSREVYRKPAGLEDLSVPETAWSALKYIKALDFWIWLSPKIQSGEIKTKSGDLLIIADEVWRMITGWAPLYAELFAKKSERVRKGEDDTAVESAKWLYNWYMRAMGSWLAAKDATLKNIKPKLMLIYQEHITPSWSSMSSTEYNGINKANAFIFRTLENMGKRGFIGYDEASIAYGGVLPTTKIPNKSDFIQPVLTTTKGKKFCNVNDRYFAWVDDVDSQGVNGDSTTAQFIKPFLILNDADENGTFVQQLKGQLKNSVGTDEKVEEIMKQFRDKNGKLEESIGFEGYLREMTADMEGYSLGEAFNESYRIFEEVITKFGYMEASGASDPMEYFSDFRAEFMPNWSRMDRALAGEKLGKDGSGSEDGIDSEYSGVEFTGEENEDLGDSEGLEEGVGSSEGLENDVSGANEAVSGETVGNEEKPARSAFDSLMHGRESNLSDEFIGFMPEGSEENGVFSAGSEDFSEKSDEFDSEPLTESGAFNHGDSYSGYSGRSAEKEPINVREYESSVGYSNAIPDGSKLENAKGVTMVQGIERIKADVSRLSPENSVDCTNLSLGGLLSHAPLFTSTKFGADMYRREVLNGVLDRIDRSIGRGNVTKIILTANGMIVNNKLVNLNGVMGGNTGRYLSDFISFKELAKRYSSLARLGMDTEYLNAFSLEYYIDPSDTERLLGSIFDTFKVLGVVNINNHDIRRQEYLTMAQRQRMSAEMEAVKRNVAMYRATEEIGAELSANARIKPEDEGSRMRRFTRALPFMSKAERGQRSGRGGGIGGLLGAAVFGAAFGIGKLGRAIISGIQEGSAKNHYGK